MANRYTRALKQIKDTTLDEKLKLLEDLPTNNTTGIFVDTPGQYQPQEIIPGDIDSPLNLEQDGDGSPTYDGRDTSGLFQADGTIRSVEPPGDTSYVLGPMSSMYYGWGGFTQIGYIRQSDRKMVNLARITGTIEDWDGESNFTSYGQLTLEQAVWFRDQSKSDYQAFYPGPPSGGSDEYGRYLSQIIDTGKSVVEIIRAIFTPGTNKGFDPSDVFSSILGLLLGTDDSILTDFFSNSALGTQGLVFLGYLTNQLPDVIGNEFLGQNYVNDSFANMELGYDNTGKLISQVGDNVIGSGQYPTYNPATNEIELNFNYDFKSNAEEFKNKEGLHGGLAGEIQKGIYNALSPYSVDAQVGPSFVGPITGGIFGTLINSAKGLGGGKPTPGKITISPQQLQQINPEAYNQLVNGGNVPSDAASKPSQNKQVPADGAEIDPEKAIESLKNSLPADQRAQLDFQQTMSMDNFNKLSKSDQNKVMDALKNRHVSRRDGSNFKGATSWEKKMFKAQAKEAGKTKFKDGYMIDKDPNTGKTRKTPIFSTIPGMSSVLVMGNEPSGKLLTESQKRALRNVKKPVKVKEIPTKVKVKPTSRKNKTVGADMMKVPDTPKEYKPQIDIWTKEDYAANVRASQEKKNQVLELLGAASHHWSYLTEEKRRKRQERVNEELAAKYDREMEDLYERYKARQDKVDKTISSFKKPADIAPEYPKDPPPQMVNGYHPKYGKQYKHDKLDPQSAEAMPPTGNPEVDANISRATNTKEKQRKTKILYKSVRENTYWNRLQKWRYCGVLLDEGMTTNAMGMINLPATGDIDQVDTSSTYSDILTANSQMGNISINGTTLTLQGTENQIVNGDHTAYNVVRFKVNGSRSSTLKISITKGGGTSSWTDRDGGSSFDDGVSLNVSDADDFFAPGYYNGNLSSGTHLIPLPGNYKNLIISIEQFAKVATAESPGATGALRLTNVSLQRRTPVNVFVPLDDPEANAFIRDGQTDNLSPAEKKKKLEEQLAASDEYMVKQFGEGMPKTATTISDTEPQQSFMDIQVGDQRVTKVNNRTVTDTTRGIRDGKMDGRPTYTDRQGNLRVSQPKPQPQPKSTTTKTTTTSNRVLNTVQTNRISATNAPKTTTFTSTTDARNPTGTEIAAAQQGPIRPGPRGYKKPGTYDPNKFYDLKNDPSQLPSPNLPATGPGYSSIPDGTKVAASYPKPDPLDKLLKDIDDADKKLKNQPPGSRPGKGRGMGDRWDFNKFVKGKGNTMVAHHEPQGKVLSEKKRLKSPKSLADKIPGYYDGKPSPLGFPVEEPPKMINGYHPDLVDGKKVSQRYNRLDPISAKAMPPTGNPHIDKKVKAAAAKGKKKTFKEFRKINESDWTPVAGDGPTNSASQTFVHPTGATITASGLGGVEGTPSTVTIDMDGERFDVAAPEYVEYGMQGYAKPLGKDEEFRKKQDEEFRKKQDENLQKIKDTLKSLGTSWEEMRSNSWALLKSDGTSITIEPTSPNANIFNWTDNVKITVGKPDPDAEDPPSISRRKSSSWTPNARRDDVIVQNSMVVKTISLEIGEKIELSTGSLGKGKWSTRYEVIKRNKESNLELNKQLDASEKFTKEIDADEFMKGRVTDTTKPQKSFLDTVADAFGAGTAKNVFDYHMDWNKTQDPSPQDLTHLVTPEDKKLLQDLVDKHSSNATDELIELGINSELQHTIGLSHGLRNSLGVLDHPRGDGARIEGNNIVIRKAYDFEGGFVGGATGLTGAAAALYGLTQGAFSKTGAMDMFVRVPFRRKKKVNESTWNKLNRHRGA